MEKKKKNLCISGCLIIVAFIFTVLVKVLDVQAVGIEGTNLGFATLNVAVHNLIGEHEIFYYLTQITGIFSIIIALGYVAYAGFQLYKKKDLKKIDKELYILGGFYAIVGVIYVLFEKIIINYRPVLEDGVLEASYPSSHTVLAVCICGSAILINKKLFGNKFPNYFNYILFGVAGVTVIGRLLSGVHWFTDILGGFLISCALLMTFGTVIFNLLENKNNLQKEVNK